MCNRVGLGLVVVRVDRGSVPVEGGLGVLPVVLLGVDEEDVADGLEHVVLHRRAGIVLESLKTRGEKIKQEYVKVGINETKSP